MKFSNNFNAISVENCYIAMSYNDMLGDKRYL